MIRVYFMRPIGMQGPVKIGISTDMGRRLSRLNLQAAFPLEVAASLPGDMILEARLHNRFSRQHSHGEFFHWSAELQAVIDQVNAGTFDPATLPAPHRVDRLGRQRRAQHPDAEHNRLLQEIDAYLIEHGVRGAELGRDCLGDRALVARLRKGRILAANDIEKIRAFIGAAEQAEAA